jgi:hypothetical protein
MAAPRGGEPSPPPSPAASFRKLLASQGKKLPPAEPPSFVKKLDSIPEIDLPPDHPMHVAISLSDRGLVGQFMGLWPSARTTDNWIQRNWRPLIKNSVTCYAVGRGFFIFEFISQEDRDLIFRNGSYFMGTQGLYLNRWTPSFDPMVEVPKDVPVWVRLPNLPIHCWNPTSLQAIGNGLGQYIDRADPKEQYSCACICVEVDLEVGLPEAIKLKVGEWHHYQKLDYEQLPFKCRGCHEYDHFQRNCPKNPSKEKENGEGWQQPKKGKTSSKTKGPRNEKTTPAQPTEQGIQPGAMTENSFRLLDQSQAGTTIGEAPQEAPPAKETHGKSIPDIRELPVPEIEEEKAKTGKGKDAGPDIEEGEVSSESEYEGASDTLITPKKTGRGRKSKKEERDKETYKDILNGSQPTIRQLINVRQTRKHSKALQGAHTSPPGKS